MPWSPRWFATLALIGAAACATPAPRPTGGDPAPGAPDAASAPSQRKSIDILLRTEPNALVTALGLVGANARPSRYFHEFVNGYLTVRDGEDEVSPHLALALPSVDGGTWRVFDDGRMEVTWKLRPAIKWHDGVALTSEDVRFSWEMANTPPTLFGASTISRYVERIDTPDPTTFVMHWKETQQFGGELGERQFDILPRHVMEEAYRADPASIPSHPQLSSPEAFVGSGPYRPGTWERGSYLTLEAFDQYFLGRPKIDRITFRVIPDSRTAMANLLAGAADAGYLALEFPDGRIVEREWASAGRGTVQFVPGSLTMLINQFRPELASPPDLLTLPVRRALAHATNKQDLVDGLDLPSEMVAHSTAFPATAIGDAVGRTLVRYPYDPNRALALLAEAGWQPGGDGVLMKGGRAFDLEFRADTTPIQGTIYPLLQQQYRQVGINLVPNMLVGQVLQDRVVYPGVLSTGLTVNNLIYVQRWHSRYTAGPNTRYSGENRQGYLNPAVDEALDKLITSIRREDQLRYWAESWRLITEDVGVIPMFFQLDTYIVRKGLTGQLHKNPLGSAAYQIHLWDAL